MIVHRATTLGDRARVAAILDGWGMRPVARLGELVDPVDDPAVIAVDAEGEIVGVATLRVDGEACELGTLFAVEERRRGGGEAGRCGRRGGARGGLPSAVARHDE